MEGPTIVVPYGYAQRGIGRTETSARLVRNHWATWL